MNLHFDPRAGPSDRIVAWRRVGRARLRRIVADVHAWIGAAVGLFMMLVGATGAALGFAYELMRAETGGFEVTGTAPDGPMPVDDYVAKVQELAGADFIPLGYIGPHGEIVNPAPMVYGLSAPPDAGGEQLVATFDPATGQPTALFQLYDTWTHWLIDLHYELVAGPVGAIFMAVIALLLVLLATAGIILWWPIKRSALKKARTFSWRGTGLRKIFSLHSVFGFWFALPIIAWSLSGAYWSQPNWFPKAVAPQLQEPPANMRAQLEQANCGGDVSPQAATAIALAQFPNAGVVEHHFPAQWQAWHAIHLDTNGSDAMDGDTRIWIAANCDEMIASQQLSGSEVTGPFFKALHSGRVFGPLRQFFIALVGAVFVLIGGTGLALWWRRLRRIAL